VLHDGGSGYPERVSLRTFGRQTVNFICILAHCTLSVNNTCFHLFRIKKNEPTSLLLGDQRDKALSSKRTSPLQGDALVALTFGKRSTCKQARVPRRITACADPAIRRYRPSASP
jgi:hypothetical protein